MAKILYEMECVKNKGPIYTFDEMRTLLETSEPDLKDFFTQLCSAARPFDCNKQTMDRMEKIMVFICYLLRHQYPLIVEISFDCMNCLL